jgi:hypothetical protein
MKQALTYSLKVWLTTTIAGSIITGIRLYFLYNLAYDRLANFFGVVVTGCQLGIIYYIPCWVILGLTAWYLNKKGVIVSYKKMFIILIAAILSLFPFILMDYRSLFSINGTGLFAGFPPDLYYTITYVGVTVVSSWFYKVKSDNMMLDVNATDTAS